MAKTKSASKAEAQQQEPRAASGHEGGKWVPHEIVDGEARVVEGQGPKPVFVLDRACALPELAASEEATLIDRGIQSFRDEDGRTMNVVVKPDGCVHKQELNHG